jgi:hypothetical protein
VFLIFVCIENSSYFPHELGTICDDDDIPSAPYGRPPKESKHAVVTNYAIPVEQVISSAILCPPLIFDSDSHQLDLKTGAVLRRYRSQVRLLILILLEYIIFATSFISSVTGNLPFQLKRIIFVYTLLGCSNFRNALSTSINILVLPWSEG